MIKLLYGVHCFTLTPAGQEGGDCTRPYDVSLCKDFTVEELIRVITEGVDECGRSEWGYIGICNRGYYPFTVERCEYRGGEIISKNIPEEQLRKKVVSVRASGGWSRMDYCLTIEEGGE